MTQSQIMMRLRDIQRKLDELPDRSGTIDNVEIGCLDDARMTLFNLIAQMLVDERRAAEAHRMSELPFDGQEKT